MMVEGKGIVQARPDTAIASLGVSTENIQLQTAQNENADIMIKVLNAVKAEGIPSEDIQTQTYSVQPQYDYIDGKQVLRGYQVVHMLRITIEGVERAGAVIDSAVNAGANIVSGIDLTLKNPARYYDEALGAALEDAVDKALTIGEKLSVNVIPNLYS
jgi:uncharacterized protein YggE